MDVLRIQSLTFLGQRANFADWTAREWFAAEIRKAYEQGWKDREELTLSRKKYGTHDIITNTDTLSIIYSKAQGWEE